ncbi:MAG: prephenate dehydrogenase [Lachnospiraceae bacterium]|nr:prephenate dehydrogenase [Lachnospiraceae bacterium]
MNPKKIGFIGLGLIGGSIAKTIHRVHPDIKMIAYKPHAEALKDALDEGVLTAICEGVSEDFKDCDIIFLCAPVLDNNDYIEKLAEYVHDDMLITDVGSVKTGIHAAIEGYPEVKSHFIGGHPMCGTENTGYENATAYMLENAYYLLTPTPEVPREMVSSFEEFIRSIGAIPLILDCEKHDFAVGSISHLPTVIASTLVNLVQDLDDDGETLRTIAAGGFRDITRIASSDPTMWENICIANRDQILDLIDAYVAAMQSTRETIAGGNGDEILEFFDSAKEYRDSFHISSGALHPVYQLFLDLIDEAGGIATVATILATNMINIKNIGIIHNREFQQGVLQVEFYDRPSFDKAVELLKRHHYNVYE